MNDLLEKNEWDVLEKVHTPQIYERDRMIYWQETHADKFYYLRKGKVKIFLSSKSGMEKTLTVLESGNIFGEAAFFDGMPRVSSAKALTKSEIISVTRKSLTKCINLDPQLAISIMKYLSQTIRMLSAQVDSMTFLSADRRIANLLLNLSKNSKVQITHEELSYLAGVSRVTVSRILSNFTKNKLISAKYRNIIILNENKLKELTE